MPNNPVINKFGTVARANPPDLSTNDLNAMFDKPAYTGPRGASRYMTLDDVVQRALDPSPRARAARSRIAPSGSMATIRHSFAIGAPPNFKVKSSAFPSSRIRSACPATWA